MISILQWPTALHSKELDICLLHTSALLSDFLIYLGHSGKWKKCIKIIIQPYIILVLNSFKQKFQRFLLNDFHKSWHLRLQTLIKYSNEMLQPCSYFETFWSLSKFSFQHRWSKAWLLVINWYITVASWL